MKQAKETTAGIHMMRIPFVSEYEGMVDIVECENAVMNWQDMGSITVDADNRRHNPSKGESPIIIAGGSGALSFETIPMDERRDNAGFRPIVTGINMFNVTAGQVVPIGTLYMDGNPVRVPKYPLDGGNIAAYIPGTKLQMRESLDDEDYKVYGIYIGGNAFIADRVLLTGVSATDLSSGVENHISIVTDKQPEPAKEDDANKANPVLSLNEAYEDKNSIFWYWCNACGEINTPGADRMAVGDVEDMPAPVQDIYENFWTELYELTCYVVQYNAQNGLALCALLDDSYIKDLVEGSKLLKDYAEGEPFIATIRRIAGKMAAQHMAELVPEGDKVLFGDDTDPDGDEILIFIPQKNLTTREELEALCKKWSEEVYTYFEKMFKELIPIVVAETLSSLKDTVDLVISENTPKDGNYQSDLYAAGCHDGMVMLMNYMGIKHNRQYIYPF